MVSFGYSHNPEIGHSAVWRDAEADMLSIDRRVYLNENTAQVLQILQVLPVRLAQLPLRDLKRGVRSHKVREKSGYIA